MSWKQVRLAIILGMLVMLFVSPYVVSGAFTDADRQKLNQIAEKGLDIWDNIKNVWQRTKDIYREVMVDISTGATEYVGGEEGVIFAKVTVAGQPIPNAHCDAIIFNSTKGQIDGFKLTYVNSSRGLYSHNFIVPTEVGVYMVDVVCVEPTNDTFQCHHFMGDGDPATDLYFKNTTQTGNTTRIILMDVGENLECYPDRFSVSYADFENGEFEPYRFLTHIHNITIWVKKDLGTLKEWTIVLRFFKETQYGELTLGAIVNTTLVSTSPTEITFGDFYANAPWDDLSLLEVEFCAKTVQDAEKDIEFLFGSATEDSYFTIHTLKVNATTNFEVGGSSELHISPLNITGIGINVSAIDELRCWLRNYLALLHSTEVTNRSCIDPSTLREDKRIEYVFEGDDACADCINMSKSQDIYCDWGCNNESNRAYCNPDPMWRNLILLIVIIVILCIVAGLLKLGGVF